MTENVMQCRQLNFDQTAILMGFLKFTFSK